MKREKDVDRVFVEGVKQLGGTTIKLSMLGRYGTSGWPDRLVLLPGGFVAFVELKAPGKQPTSLQKRRLQELTTLGFKAAWFDDPGRALAYVRGCVPASIRAVHVDTPLAAALDTYRERARFGGSHA